MLLLRGPLLLAFVIGCGISVLAAGRFTPRLIADGAVSFAFVPAFHVLALRAVFRQAPAGVSFPRAVDIFFAGGRVWLVWFVAIAALSAVLPPRSVGPWLLPILAATVIPLVLSLLVDFRFFRDVMQRPRGRAIRDLAVERAIAWTLIALYFAGPSIANDPAVGIRHWLTGG